MIEVKKDAGGAPVRNHKVEATNVSLIGFMVDYLELVTIVYEITIVYSYHIIYLLFMK